MRTFVFLSLAALASRTAIAASPAQARELQHDPKILQFGIAVTGKFALGGPFCPKDTACILGSGGGIAARIGHAFGRWYLGGGYDFSKHDSSLLYRLAILQQVRGEVRYQYPLSRNVFLVPFGAFGMVGYGNEWSIQTWGPGVTLGAAAETHIGSSVIGIGFSWQGTYLQRLADPGRAGVFYSAGVPQFLSLELRLEAIELF